MVAVTKILSVRRCKSSKSDVPAGGRSAESAFFVSLSVCACMHISVCLQSERQYKGSVYLAVG